MDLDPATLTARPALATKMPQKINATTYRATLRKGATFHDGSPVRAEDVVFSFERVLDPENASLMAQFVPFIDQVTAVDASTVEFKLKHPFALFPSRISVVRVVPEKIAGADPKASTPRPSARAPTASSRRSARTRSSWRRTTGTTGRTPPRPGRWCGG